MQPILDLVNQEPVLVGTLLTALIGLAAAFGFHLTDVQTAAIVGVAGAIVTIYVRSRVSPVTKT